LIDFFVSFGLENVLYFCWGSIQELYGDILTIYLMYYCHCFTSEFSFSFVIALPLAVSSLFILDQVAFSDNWLRACLVSLFGGVLVSKCGKAWQTPCFFSAAVKRGFVGTKTRESQNTKNQNSPRSFQETKHKESGFSFQETCVYNHENKQSIRCPSL
jgi:hypothetical protein